MPSNTPDHETDSVAATVSEDATGSPRASRAPKMTRRQRRKRIVLLTLLLVILAALALATYYFLQNRSLPSVSLSAPAAGIAPPEYLFSIAGKGASELQRPAGVAVAADGRVYAVDSGKRRVSVFTRNGAHLFSFSKIDKGVLRAPVSVAVKGSEVWVTDRRFKAIYIYDLSGKYLRRFEAKGEPKFTWGPLAIAFAPGGGLRATDVGSTDRHRIVFFTADASRTVTVGKTTQATTPEDSPGEFFFPDGIAVADDGRVFVADGNNRRVQVFSPSGEFKYFVDTSGIPRGVAIDAKEHLYVVDAVAHAVDIYDLSGTRLAQFGSRGFGPGQFNYPVDIAIDKGQRIYVTDRENNQVQVWGWPIVAPAVFAPFTTQWGWLLCLTPLLLLFIPLALRRTRLVVTPDFVDALIEAGEITSVAARKRLKLHCPEADLPLYQGRDIDGIDLGVLITGEEYSESDMRAMRERLGTGDREAILLSMGLRAKALATQDRELRKLALLAEVTTVDIEEFLDRFIRSGRR